MPPPEVPIEYLFSTFLKFLENEPRVDRARDSKFMERSINLYWYLLAEQGAQEEIEFNYLYNTEEDVLELSFILPSYEYDNSEIRDLTISIEETSPTLPDYLRVSIYVEISDDSLGERVEIDPSLELPTSTISMDAIVLAQDQMFYPTELGVQIDIDDKNAYYFFRYDRNGNLYKIEAMDPELTDLLETEVDDTVALLELTDFRDLGPALLFINSQLEDDDDPNSSCNQILLLRPVHIWDTITYLAQARAYRIAPNGIRIPSIIYQ